MVTNFEFKRSSLRRSVNHACNNFQVLRERLCDGNRNFVFQCVRVSLAMLKNAN